MKKPKSIWKDPFKCKPINRMAREGVVGSQVSKVKKKEAFGDIVENITSNIRRLGSIEYKHKDDIKNINSVEADQILKKYKLDAVNRAYDQKMSSIVNETIKIYKDVVVNSPKYIYGLSEKIHLVLGNTIYCYGESKYIHVLATKLIAVLKQIPKGNQDREIKLLEEIVAYNRLV